MNKTSTESAVDIVPAPFRGVVTQVRRKKPTAVVLDGSTKILVPRYLIEKGGWQHRFVRGAKIKGSFVFGGGGPPQAVNIASVI